MPHKTLTLRGQIIPAGLDEDDRPIAVFIVTDEDEEFLIDPYGKGDQLLDYIDAFVEVTGNLHNDDGEYTVSVQSFHPFDPSDDEQLDEEAQDSADP